MVLWVPASAGLEDVARYLWALFELRMFGFTTAVGLVGGHGGVFALSCARLQPLCLPNMGAHRSNELFIILTQVTFTT